MICQHESLLYTPAELARSSILMFGFENDYSSCSCFLGGLEKRVLGLQQDRNVNTL